MEFKRNIYSKLFDWKNSSLRSPLILYGPRQIGKTYILKEFGRKHFSKFIHLDFEEEKDLESLFNDSLNPKMIINKIETYLGQKIIPHDTLLIFDEIQKAPNALTSLKYFKEKAPQYYIVAAGSLLGLKFGKKESFPVGKVNFLNLHPLSFFEFLDNIGKNSLKEYLSNLQSFSPIEPIFHKELLELLKIYFILGGMPAVLECYLKTNDFSLTRKVQKEILKALELDFAKYSQPIEMQKIFKIWQAIPAQLAKENKKFKLIDIHTKARYREYSSSLSWLLDSKLIHKVSKVEHPKIPLSAHAQENIFKLYHFDVGLLGAMAGISEKIILSQDKLFSEYNGAFSENFVLEEMISNEVEDIYYWASDNIAEVDFIISFKDSIFPLEVKASIDNRKKSLLVYDQKFKPKIISRTTAMNLKIDGRVCNYPLYMVAIFPELYLRQHENI